MREDPLTKYKTVKIGVIDVRPHAKIETAADVSTKISKALGVLGQTEEQISRIWIGPDCGFRTFKDYDGAGKKMKALVDGTRIIRDGLLQD